MKKPFLPISGPPPDESAAEFIRSRRTVQGQRRIHLLFQQAGFDVLPFDKAAPALAEAGGLIATLRGPGKAEGALTMADWMILMRAACGDAGRTEASSQSLYDWVRGIFGGGGDAQPPKSLPCLRAEGDLKTARGALTVALDRLSGCRAMHGVPTVDTGGVIGGPDGLEHDGGDPTTGQTGGATDPCTSELTDVGSAYEILGQAQLDVALNC